MRPIWRFFDSLTIIKKTLIFQGTLVEFLIKAAAFLLNVMEVIA